MKNYIYIISLLIFLFFGCKKDNTSDKPKENVIDSPFQVKYEIITDNNINNISGGDSFSITYSIEKNGILILNKSESFSTRDIFPTIWTKEFTATSTYRPYTLNLSATIPLFKTGKQYITGNIYVNGNLVATQKGTLFASTNESTIGFAWAAQKP